MECLSISCVMSSLAFYLCGLYLLMVNQSYALVFLLADIMGDAAHTIIVNVM